MRIKSSSERSDRRSRGSRARVLLDVGSAMCSPALERRRFWGMVLKLVWKEGRFGNTTGVSYRNWHVMISS